MHATERLSLRHILLDGWRPYFWIALLGLVLYAHTAGFGYTHADDTLLIQVTQPVIGDLRNITTLFLRNTYLNDLYPPVYRPVMSLSFIADALVAGAGIWYYHLTDAIYNVIAASLLFAVLMKFSHRRAIALAAAGFFVVHPVAVSDIAWIPGRQDLLLGVFILASFLCFLQFTEDKKNRWAWAVLHSILFALALLTKETALALPILCLMWVYLCTREQSKTFFSRDLIGMCSGWLGVTMLWLMLRAHALGGGLALQSITDVHGGTPTSMLLQFPAILLVYLGKIIYPNNLSYYSVVSPLTLVAAIGGSVVVAYALATAMNERRKYWVFGIAWFVLFVAPTLMSGGSLTGGSALVESRLYLPLMGVIFVLLEAGVIREAGSLGYKAVILYLILLTTLFTTSYIYSFSYASNIAFFENMMRHTNGAERYEAASWYHRFIGNPGLADKELMLFYQESLKNSQAGNGALPSHALLGIAGMSERSGDYDRAQGMLEFLARYPSNLGLILRTDYYFTRVLLGELYYYRGRCELARSTFADLFTLYPYDFFSDYREFSYDAGYYLHTIDVQKLGDFMYDIEAKNDAQLNEQMRICENRGLATVRVSGLQ